MRLAYLPNGSDAATQRYLRAVVATWQGAGLDAQLQILDHAQPLPERGVWLVVSAADITPQLQHWIDDGGRALLLGDDHNKGLAAWHDAQGRVLARHATSGKGQLLRLATALDPRQLPELLAADFPQQLLVLMQDQSIAPGLASAAMLEPVTGAVVDRLPLGRVPLQHGLILLLALCWLAERLVAAYAGRRP